MALPVVTDAEYLSLLTQAYEANPNFGATCDSLTEVVDTLPMGGFCFSVYYKNTTNHNPNTADGILIQVSAETPCNFEVNIIDEREIDSANDVFDDIIAIRYDIYINRLSGYEPYMTYSLNKLKEMAAV